MNAIAFSFFTTTHLSYMQLRHPLFLKPSHPHHRHRGLRVIGATTTHHYTHPPDTTNPRSAKAHKRPPVRRRKSGTSSWLFDRS